MAFDIGQYFPRPKTVVKRDYLLYLILSIVCIATCLIETILIGVFYFEGDIKLMGVAILGLITALSVWPFTKAGKLNIAVNLCFLWVFVFSVLNTIYFGWYAGFQYYLIALIVIYSSQTKLSMPHIIFTCFICIGAFLFLYTRIFNEISISDSPLIKTLHLINTLLASLIMVFSSNYISRILDALIEKLQHTANTDALTKLVNRRHMTVELARQNSISKRHKNKNSIILIDVDYFKNINDTYGHDAGDFILQEFSELLSKHLRKSDIVARWGGEEFLILAPFTDKQQAGLLAEKLRKFTAEHTFMYKEITLKITISLGVAELNVEKDIQDSLSDADQLLYKAKDQGRNIVITQE